MMQTHGHKKPKAFSGMARVVELASETACMAVNSYCCGECVMNLSAHSIKYFMFGASV